MDIPFTENHILHLIIFQVVLLFILLDNIRVTRGARRHPQASAEPMVSVLVPARNEQRSIARCVQSLLEQDYPKYEVIVLDDQSSDGTRAILEHLSPSNPRLRLLDGKPIPGEISGKNWACVQLSRQAKGDLLLFTDADTTHREDMISSVVTTLMGENADLLTGFPRQEVQSWGERILVPFFSWVILCFIPLSLAYRLNLSFLSSGVGQFMLFRREAYQAIGGHESVSASIVEDISLVRRIKSSKQRWRMIHLADLTACRMYQDSREAIDGFTKNLFAVFDYRLIPFLFAFLWLLVLFWEPFFLLVNREYAAQPGMIVVCTGLAFLLWFLTYLDLGIPLWLAFLYPLTILATVIVAGRSAIYSIRGYSTWKGRGIPPVKWRWF
jgi:chlorobactene glucosyltransferase